MFKTEFDRMIFFALSAGPRYPEPGETPTLGRRQGEESEIRFRGQEAGRGIQGGRKKVTAILFQVVEICTPIPHHASNLLSFLLWFGQTGAAG